VGFIGSLFDLPFDALVMLGSAGGTTGVPMDAWRSVAGPFEDPVIQ